MVYFRTDNNKCQIYNALANSITIQTDDDVVVDPNITYDFKVLYNPTSGLIQVYLDNNLVSSWTDPAPLISANSISLRTGNCTAIYDDITVYQSRNTTETITVGNGNADIRFQNSNPTTPAANIKSVVIDQANNWSTIINDMVDVDWTQPSNVTVNDGLSSDIDVFNINTEISGNWTTSTDTHSGVTKYEYAVGTSAGATNTINWINNGTSTSFTATGLSLTYNTTYYVSVRSTNGAGLISAEVSSDGQLLENPTATPSAGFSTNNTTVCEGDSIQLINSSTNATSYLWSVTGGVMTDNTANNPYVTFANTGTYNVTLVASGPGGSDQLSQNVTVTVNPGPTANATPNNTTVNLPNAIVSFTNSSSNATSYTWDFGDGSTSTDQNPWNLYGSIGTYEVTMVAMNAGCSNDTTYFTINVEDTLSSSAVEELNWEMVTTYPNPFENNIIIKGLDKVDATVNISIIDMTGRQVYLQSNLTTQPILYINDLGNLSKGVYQLVVSTKDARRGFYLVK
jgi:PKD repeat protein